MFVPRLRYFHDVLELSKAGLWNHFLYTAVEILGLLELVKQHFGIIDAYYSCFEKHHSIVVIEHYNINYLRGVKPKHLFFLHEFPQYIPWITLIWNRIIGPMMHWWNLNMLLYMPERVAALGYSRDRSITVVYCWTCCLNHPRIYQASRTS